ncbi:glycoside hydrolase N-terminal domain-containing protein [Paenibacillus sp. CFBP 13594]|uniref:glycosyl hydrolase family 95 catalytic domain-containing protein n=1 Tax=Paenibacillus sp. CFBP 13594 TaxID=2774037 RepID=UPI001785BF97|nr:glycoside hydrolase N-terminal domain-containing protein [Paenibacillus sp. CFBP 13594]MBD8836948.1 glycoside hydrolase N-terminal domain-containing protein [Paenibacillus sp. CFBP 13594]
MTNLPESIRLYKKGNYANAYREVPAVNPGNAWREGMVSGNGENGYITSGSPYTDSFIFQNMFFNYPSKDPRVIPEELTEQLTDARQNVLKQNDKWKITNETGSTRIRTFYYSYHPGHQLRFSIPSKGSMNGYERWTNYETAETGVRYSDENGEWVRTSFTSREDNVTFTKITASSTGTKINITLSIDDISSISGANKGHIELKELQYKKLVDSGANYLAQVAHYPVYQGSELAYGGYAGLTQIVVVNGTKKRMLMAGSHELINVGREPNPVIQIKDADAVYLITRSSRTHSMGRIEEFAEMTQYKIVDQLYQDINAVVQKYLASDGQLNYDAALAAHTRKHSVEFNAVSFSIDGDDHYKNSDNQTLITTQKSTPDRVNHAFMEQVYNQGRYAMICCSGTSAPRLYGMWTGEWNPGWRGIYTLDANVNLQVASMNTGHLTQAQLGYIIFFLRNTPDFEYNARMAYGMHDALQVSVNSDGDRGMHVEYDNDYPFEYWNAGASWCLLPIYEYWQCYGNQKIPLHDNMRIHELQTILSVQDGGMSDEEFTQLLDKGYLDLAEDILLPLLTKQANFWQQICTPEYFTDVNGKACYQFDKKTLNSGEKYLIIPTYSPENHPIGYNSTITANATMDISAARDGLSMVISMEKAVKRDGYETAIAKWTALLELLPNYKYDYDGALREWAMSDYTENNNHRHLSHLYVAWPAYETQTDPELKQAAKIAIDNRDRFNTVDDTAGHGWMHKALVQARLKNGDGVLSALLPMMRDAGYYSSLMTDHDSNRRCNCYCTDTSFGTVGAINEALLFSNTGEIEILPALPSDWTKGSIHGLMARTWVEVKALSWNLSAKTVHVVVSSSKNGNTIRIRVGLSWTQAKIDGSKADVQQDLRGKYIQLTLSEGTEVTVAFQL